MTYQPNPDAPIAKYIHIMDDSGGGTYTNEFMHEDSALRWLDENWDYIDYLCTITVDEDDFAAESWYDKLEEYRREQDGK